MDVEYSYVGLIDIADREVLDFYLEILPGAMTSQSHPIEQTDHLLAWPNPNSL